MEEFKKEYLELCLKHGLYISTCCTMGISQVKDAYSLIDQDEWISYGVEGEEALKEIIKKL